MHINSMFLLTAATSVFMAAQGYAQDTSLYAEAAPDDASFVRFVGFEAQANPQFAGKTFDLSTQDQNVYVPVSSAALKDVAQGSYVTVLNTDPQPTIITEATRDVRSKVHLFLVNGTQTSLDLRLADNSAVVVDNVVQNTSGVRAVNPVSVTLGVFPDGSDTPLATFDVALKRGQNLSFVADAHGVRLLENRFGLVAK